MGPCCLCGAAASGKFQLVFVERPAWFIAQGIHPIAYLCEACVPPMAGRQLDKLQEDLAWDHAHRG